MFTHINHEEITIYPWTI